MSRAKYCPDCGDPVFGSSCACGWREKPANGDKSDYVRDGRCEFRADGERCPKSGSISPSIRGGGPWYCRWHWRVRDDPYQGALVLDDMRKNPQAYTTPRHWTDDYNQ